MFLLPGGALPAVTPPTEGAVVPMAPTTLEVSPLVMRHHGDMTAPTAVIDRMFVKTWSERYRCGSTNSRWRAGPKLAAAIKAHPQLRVLSGITTYWELEEYIFGTIAPAVQKRHAYTLPEFLVVGYWKTPRQLANYRKNAKEEVRTVSHRALKARLPDDARPQALRTLSGVRVPVASALLTVWDSDAFTIIDAWAVKTLSLCGESINGIGFDEHPQPWWERHYDLYLQACRAIQQRVKPLTLRQVDRALWKWGQLNAPA